MALPAQAKRTTDRLQGHATPDDHVMQCPHFLLSGPLFLSLSHCRSCLRSHFKLAPAIFASGPGRRTQLLRPCAAPPAHTFLSNVRTADNSYKARMFAKTTARSYTCTKWQLPEASRPPTLQKCSDSGRPWG